MAKARSYRPLLESLEDRTTPAVLGSPWLDPGHLSLSFVPDGTSIGNHTSSLFQTLNASMPAAVWQSTILQALQAWVVNANLNVGVVPDSGAALGAAGPTQADPRFGDLRIAMHAMAADVASVSVPNQPALSGTLTGDIFLNSNQAFTAPKLFTVALHEFGHVLGLEHSADPRSVMFAHFNEQATLTSADIANLQAIYGRRAPDRWEGQNGNNIPRFATRIKYSQNSDGYNGATPLVVWGDVMTNRDVDLYWIRPLVGYSGPMTFQLQSSGLSLLAPRITIADELGRTLAARVSGSQQGDTLRITLPAVNPALKYFVKVESGAGDLFAVGRYALAVTFDANVTTTPEQLQEVIRGPNETLSENDIIDLFTSPAGTLVNDDLHADDTFLTAARLRTSIGFAQNTHFDTLGSISDGSDIDFYQIRAASFEPSVMTVTAFASSFQGVAPRVTVFDDTARPVEVLVLANGNGTSTVQFVADPGDSYFLRVQPAQVGETGNYALVAHATQQVATLTSFSAGTLSPSDPRDVYDLHVARTQMFSFLLNTRSAIPDPGPVRLDIFNSAGTLVASLQGDSPGTVSGPSVLLTPGTYAVAVRGIDLRDSVTYQITGAVISQPIGPVVDDPLFTPLFASKDNPNLFLYPDGTLSADPFLWAPPINTPPSDISLSGTAGNDGFFSLQGTFTDPDFLDTHTVTISWGDGNTTVLPLAEGVTQFGADYIYADPLNPPTVSGFPITVTVEDSNADLDSAVLFALFA